MFGYRLLLDEVLVGQRNPLELHRDVEHRIVLDAELGQHLVARLLHDAGARVVVLVHAMPEAHQAERIVLVLRARDELRNSVDRAISESMFSAASFAPPCAGPHRHAMPAATHANGFAPDELASRTVDVDAFCSWSACRMKMRSMARAIVGLTLCSSVGTAKAHVQEIGRIIEIVARVDERLADGVLVRHRGDRRIFAIRRRLATMRWCGSLMSVES